LYSRCPVTILTLSSLGFHSFQENASIILHDYVARPQSKFPTCPTASKPYIVRSD
jgi:hypothetical protein